MNKNVQAWISIRRLLLKFSNCTNQSTLISAGATAAAYTQRDRRPSNVYSGPVALQRHATRELHTQLRLDIMSSEAPQMNGEHASQEPTHNVSMTAPFKDLPKTKLIFQAAEHQETYTYDTRITSMTPFTELPSQDQPLFNPSTAPENTTLYALTTESTIFHPQGGGQPSDIGHFTQNTTEIFTVLSARVSISSPGQVLHIGHFTSTSPSISTLQSTPNITQHINPSTRHLFSRLHTAGHVLGTCTRTLLEHTIPNFDELKASHFPNSAACEFQGLIDGKHKSDIQGAVDALVENDASVRIEWWRKREFRERELERLLPGEETWREIAVLVDEEGREVQGEQDRDEETRIRVVNIVGAEVYPCGGTHVSGTKGCGKVVVKKISRAKGNSRVSYSVD